LSVRGKKLQLCSPPVSYGDAVPFGLVFDSAVVLPCPSEDVGVVPFGGFGAADFPAVCEVVFAFSIVFVSFVDVLLDVLLGTGAGEVLLGTGAGEVLLGTGAGIEGPPVRFAVAFVLFTPPVPFLSVVLPGDAGGPVACSGATSPAAWMLLFVDSTSTNALAV